MNALPTALHSIEPIELVVAEIAMNRVSHYIPGRVDQVCVDVRIHCAGTVACHVKAIAEGKSARAEFRQVEFKQVHICLSVLRFLTLRSSGLVTSN